MRRESRLLIGLAAAALTYLSLTAFIGLKYDRADKGESHYHCRWSGWHR